MTSGEPTPLPEWAPALRRLVRASKAISPGPHWWTDDLAFFGTVETQKSGARYWWDGSARFKPGDARFAFFQFTLAGWGAFEHRRGEAQRIPAGTGFFGVVPSRHRYYLPPDSPGWTFGWINVFHPYLLERIANRIRASGPVVSFGPDSAFLSSALRLISGNFKKDFRDGFEVEVALFEFVVGYERLALHRSDANGERDGLLESVRKRVLNDLSRPVDVTTLAAEHGMSRSHFTHFFRERTGLPPARVVTQTRIYAAARMLLESDSSLKEIAAACGFANSNHFSRVFQRFHHLSPSGYRKRTP